jgi:Tol biopolymer transport system component/DNA-binding winged helix-turn-helix (wHTH) protein
MAPPLQQRFYNFGLFRVDADRRLLLRGGEAVPLTPKAFDILLVLVRNRDRVVEKNELMRLIWPNTSVEENNLTRNISTLRKVLEESPNQHRFIVTIPGRGYQFAGDTPEEIAGTAIVYERHARAQVLIEEQLEPDTLIEPIQPIKTEIVEQNSWRGIAYRAAVVVAACTLVASAAWLYISRSREAVLPLPRVVPLTSLPDRAECANISPDGNLLAFGRRSDSPQLSGIYIQQIGSDHLLQVTRSLFDWCPAWSPDGGYLAFSRYGEQEQSIYLASALGGSERKLHSGAPSYPPLDWSPEGKWIAFSTAPPGHSNSVISLLSVETLEVRKLSDPIVGVQDWGPVFSPDGKQLAYVRANMIHTTAEIFVMSANGSGTRRLTSDNAWITAPPAWTRDGKSILFSSTRSGLPTLWRIPVSGGSPVQETQVGVKAFGPRVAPSGHRLIFEQKMVNSSLWSLDLSDIGENDGRRQVTASKGRNGAAELSPDGKRIVFVSDRSGSDEIYICNADGSNLLRLTNLGDANTPGVPRWSPDGQKIVFDSVLRRHTAVFVIQANGGPPLPLTDEASDNLNPSWSHDGKWIYFTSNRSGQWQIWKTPNQGGEVLQLTRQGGFSGFESSDGKSIYYAKTASEPDIWRLQLEDGEETAVSPPLHLNQWTGWALVDKGIFFVREGPEAHPVLRFLDFATNRMKDIAPLDKQPWPLWVSASADGKSALYQHVDMDVSNVMALENFR